MADVILSESVHSALVLAAASQRSGSRLHTGQVLDALARIDRLGDWSRLWLYSGEPDQIGLAGAVDPDAADDDATPRSFRTWEGVRLSATMSDCMALLAHLADVYSMRPVPPGALALALVATPSSGAARALISSGGATVGELLEIIQSDLLGTQLTDLDQVLRQSASNDRRSPHPEAGSDGLNLEARPDTLSALSAAQLLAGRRPADDLDLLQVLDRDQAVAGALSHTGIDLQILAEVAAIARGLITRTAEEVVTQAQAEAQTSAPTDAEIMIAATASPSPAMARTLRVFGASGPEVGATVGMTNMTRVVSDSTHFWSLLNSVVLLAAYVLVIVHAITSGALWQLALLLVISTGPPTSSTLSSAVVTGLAWFLAGPLVGSVKLTETAISFWRSRAERRDILNMTGVWLTEPQHNRLIQRQRRFRAALINRREAAFLVARLGRLDRAARRAAGDGRQAADVAR